MVRAHRSHAGIDKPRELDLAVPNVEAWIRFTSRTKPHKVRNSVVPEAELGSLVKQLYHMWNIILETGVPQVVWRREHISMCYVHT
jgi:hypothetical protein